MITYIDSDIAKLTLTVLKDSEVVVKEFNTEQEFKNYFVDNNILLLVSNARSYNTRISDTQIVQDYSNLKARFNL
jgi:hypothetical protein